MTRINPQALHEIVGRIYDCVLAPEGWEATVARIQRLFRWHNAILAANSLVGTRPAIQVMLGVPDAYAHIVVDPVYSKPIIELWGGPERVMEAPLEEPLIQSHMSDPATWGDNRYFVDFVMPQGIADAVTVGLTRDQTMIANIAGGRHAADGPVTEEELSGLRMLAPHLRRAVTIANLFDDMRASNEMLAGTLEKSSAGVVLVDDTMRILHANSNAQSMLTTGDPVQEVGGRLTLREELSQNSLANAVALSKEEHLARRGSGIPTRRLDGSPLLVHVLPLRGGTLRPGLVNQAAAAIFVAMAPEPMKLPAEALGLLFELTPAEVRVMELAADGLDMKNTAQRLGIAPSTVKTHLLRVYEKTGTHRQFDLAKLARNLGQF